MDAETFDDQVEACLNERYDINAVEKIYVHGDGAARIVSLGERFPNDCHVLDGFHLEKYLKKLGHYYLNRQIDLILETDWSTAFSTPPASFGKVDAAFMIHKSPGFMRSFA